MENDFNISYLWFIFFFHIKKKISMFVLYIEDIKKTDRS